MLNECSEACHKTIEAAPKIKHIHHDTKSIDVCAILEKVSAVALGVLALMTNWQLFVPYFVGGILLGAYQQVTQENNGHSHGHGSACSQGFLESITGVKLPAPLSLACNVAMTACHIDHHDTVFVPIVALILGTWTAKAAMEVGSLLYRKFQHHTLTIQIPIPSLASAIAAA